MSELCLLHDADHQHVDGPDDLGSVLQLGQPGVQQDVDENVDEVPQDISSSSRSEELVVEYLREGEFKKTLHDNQAVRSFIRSMMLPLFK